MSPTHSCVQVDESYKTNKSPHVHSDIKRKTYVLKGHFVEFLFLCGSALLLFNVTVAMASCNYIPQIMLNIVV